jgi:hypothetical protein
MDGARAPELSRVQSQTSYTILSYSIQSCRLAHHALYMAHYYSSTLSRLHSIRHHYVTITEGVG